MHWGFNLENGTSPNTVKYSLFCALWRVYLDTNLFSVGSTFGFSPELCTVWFSGILGGKFALVLVFICCEEQFLRTWLVFDLCWFGSHCKDFNAFLVSTFLAWILILKNDEQWGFRICSPWFCKLFWLGFHLVSDWLCFDLNSLFNTEFRNAYY